MVVKVFQFVIDHVRESHAEIKTSSSDLEHVVVLVLTQRQPCLCQHVSAAAFDSIVCGWVTLCLDCVCVA